MSYHLCSEFETYATHSGLTKKYPFAEELRIELV